ncbi:MAG: hypothetical protein MK108_04235 [Mariniblastus sp.]|nr:hypothetical protein [Mariniblastus sp.]
MTRRSRKNSKSKTKQFDYNALEQRNLLAVDLGINVTGATYQTDSSAYPSNATSDVGMDHIVEVMTGRLNVYNKDTATPVYSTTLDSFFTAQGSFVPNPTQDPNVVYDQLSERWFVVASGTKDQGNWIHLAIGQNTPTGLEWTTQQFVGDSTARSQTGDATVAVDADAIYITTNNFGPIVGQSVSIFSIPKSDLVAPVPTLTNMSRFENLDHTVFGQSIQVASNFEASDGRARAVGMIRGDFNEPLFVQTDILDAGDSGASASLDGPFVIGDDILREFHFPFVLEAPDVRQPYRDDVFPVDTTGYEHPIEHSNWLLNGSVVEADGGLWVAHTFSYTNELLQLTVPSSGIRWYEIDPDLHQVRLTEGDAGGYNMGLIADTADEDDNNQGDRDYFNPTFRVNEYGVAVLGYNGSGFVAEGDTTRNHLPSNYVSVGITTNGSDARRTQFEAPFETHAGLENYEIEFPSPWSEYASVRFDPEFLNTFLTTRQFANTIDRWSTQVVEVKPVDLVPLIWADNGNNVIVIRKNAASPQLMEFEIDGVVTDLLPYEVLDRVRVQGLGGADRFIIDYTNGDPLADAQLILDGGAGPDVVQSNNPGANEWVVIPTEFDLGSLSDTAKGDGTLNGTTDFVNVEELWGGDGPDHFLVTQIVPPPFPNPYPGLVGFLDGSLLGRGGDDVFEFAHNGAIGDSVNGGTGYNTLKFTNRAVNTDMELIGFGADAGFNGRTLGSIGAGPIGGDQTTDQFRDISQVIGADVNYVVNGSRIYDTLDMLPEVASTWTINDELSQYEANGVTMDFWQVDELSASNLDDTFNGIRNSMDPLVLNALDGDDTFNFSSDAPALEGHTDDLQGLVVANGGTGSNTLNVSNKSGTSSNALIIAGNISGMGEISYTTDEDGTYDVNVWGSSEDDIFRLHSFMQNNTLNVWSLDGDDEFDIQDLSTAVVNAFGGNGDDVYTIQRIQGVDHRNLTITDSVDAESDRVQLAGTILDETFTITNSTFEEDLGDLNYTGIEFFGIDSRGGNDVINVKGSPYNLYVDGGDGDDVINVSSDAGDVDGELNGNLLGIVGLVIDGGTGNNRLNISYESGLQRNVVISQNKITGLTDKPIFYSSEGGNFYGDTLSEGIQIEGSRQGNDKYNVLGLDVEHRMRIQAYDGIDRFTIRADVFGDVLVDGGADRDFYTTFFNGQVDRTVTVRDRSDETNRLDAYGTTADDVVEINPTGVYRGAEQVFFNTDLHFVGFSGLAGDDVVTLNDSAARTTYVWGQQGEDVVNVNNTDNIVGARFIGHENNDTFNLNSVNVGTYIATIGGDGDDTVNISADAMGNVFNNGQEGSDTYNFDLSTTANRKLLAHDSGLAGVDRLNSIGTDGDDSIEVRSTRVMMENDTHMFTSNLEVAATLGGEGEDFIEMFASVAGETRLEGGLDNDTLRISSTALADLVTTHGGEGDDTTITKVVRDTTTLRQNGDAGDDVFVFGSTMAEDNGNLGYLRGNISVSGGDNSSGTAEDMIYMNDAGLDIRYSYYSHESRISPLPGPANLPRPEFAGVSFDDTVEFVHLEGTQAANYFTVHSNEFTRFLFNGNDPHRTSTGDFIQLVAESGDGHVHWISNATDGDGYWTFGNGNKDIEYKSMEGYYNPPQFIIWNGGGDDENDDSNPGGPQLIQQPGTTDDVMELDTLASFLASFDISRPDSASSLNSADSSSEDLDASELDSFFELI